MDIGGNAYIIFKQFLLWFARYSIERMSDPGKYFYIDITSGSLMTVLPLDREEMAWHNISVLAMEMSKQSISHIQWGK